MNNIEYQLEELNSYIEYMESDLENLKTNVSIYKKIVGELYEEYKIHTDNSIGDFPSKPIC